MGAIGQPERGQQKPGADAIRTQGDEGNPPGSRCTPHLWEPDHSPCILPQLRSTSSMTIRVPLSRKRRNAGGRPEAQKLLSGKGAPSVRSREPSDEGEQRGHGGRIKRLSSALAAPGRGRTGWGGHERGRVGGERGSSVGCHAFADHGLADDGQCACGRDAAICGDRPLLGLEHESDHDFGDVVDLGHRRSDYFQHFGFSRSGHGSGDRVGDDHCYGSDDPRRGYGDFDGHAEGVAGGDGVAGGGERAGGRNGPADGHG